MELTTEDRLQLQAPAKINLFLQILGKRDDGYHELQTLMQKVSLFDTLNFSLRQSGIRVTSNSNFLGEERDNLVYKAAALFFSTQEKKVPVSKAHGIDIHLEKKIPIAAGLGGGSSDAAAVLLAMDKLFQTKCSSEELGHMGLALGADVPFFLRADSASWARGVGEVLDTAIPLDTNPIVLVNPGFALSTKWVYDNFALTWQKKTANLTDSRVVPKGCSDKNPFGRQKICFDELTNDLEQVSCSRYNKIGELKETLIACGACVAMMSGSGPTVFGLFTSDEGAQRCYSSLKKEFDQTFLAYPV